MTPAYNSTREIPYFMAFRAKFVVLVEMVLPSYYTTHFKHKQNNNNLRAKLDLLKKKRDLVNL